MNGLPELGRVADVAIFYEAPHRVRRTLTDILALLGDIPVMVGREMTKAHEELVNSTISLALDRLAVPRGEFTIVVNIGQTTKKDASHVPPADTLLAEFGQLTDSGAMTRRAAVGELARRYGMSSNAVYAALEDQKKSGF